MAEQETEAELLDIPTTLRIEALSLAVQVAQPSVDETTDDIAPEPAGTTIERAKRFENYLRGIE